MSRQEARVAYFTCGVKISRAATCSFVLSKLVCLFLNVQCPLGSQMRVGGSSASASRPTALLNPRLLKGRRGGRRGSAAPGGHVCTHVTLTDTNYLEIFEKSPYKKYRFFQWYSHLVVGRWRWKHTSSTTCPFRGKINIDIYFVIIHKYWRERKFSITR